MFLGVDGGGSKTAYALVDAEGNLQVARVGGRVDYLADGLGEARAELLAGIRTTLAGKALVAADVTFAFVGLPAYGEDPEAVAMLDSMPSAILDPGRYRCGNDMVCSWAGSLACVDGISVIAGTGSMAYGTYAGREARSGGWGELFGDEGSAYWIAREGMNLFSRMSDGRLPRGPLHGLVRGELGLEKDLHLGAKIYRSQADRRDAFAKFALLVHQAAVAGDTDAASVFTRGAGELVKCVVAVRRALDAPASVVLPVSHSGGVFQHAKAMVDAFRAGLAAAPFPFEYRAPQLPPAAGAALYAARVAGSGLPSTAVQRLRKQCESSDVFR
jgi:N-acetylglucosamine kinase-like BadF-type ATPase